MINQEDNSSTSIIERSTDYKPPHTWRSWLIGRPLSTADAPHETIGKVVGLAVFASDALSSNAYATQEIMVVLAAAGTAALILLLWPLHQTECWEHQNPRQRQKANRPAESGLLQAQLLWRGEA